MTRLSEGTPSFADEAERVQARRRALATADPEGVPTFALALSGGGIRSATFALGVMQALNEVSVASSGVAKPGTATEPAGDVSTDTRDVGKPDRYLSNLLARFDYLSTVSGGGYVGAFFCSMFIPGRIEGVCTLSRPQASRDAAQLAYEVMADEPPSRTRIQAMKGVRSDRQPLAWLRENGRYLAPTGAGDMVYAGALAIRNWLAIQYVLATAIVAVLAALMLMRALLVLMFRDERVLGFFELSNALSSSIASGLIWGIGGAVVVLWSFPVGVAFWLAHADPSKSDSEIPTGYSFAAWGDFLLGFVLAGGVAWAGIFERYRAFADFFFALGIQALLGFLVYVATWRGCSVTAHRVVLTRRLALSMKVAAIVFLFALADSLALMLYDKLQASSAALSGSAVSTALLAAAIWSVRHLSVLFDQKSGVSWWRKLPIDWVAGIGAFVIGLALIVIWAILINWMMWVGTTAALAGLDWTSVFLLLAIGSVTAAMAMVIGYFPAFINLSSLQSIYGARLTRAYLGASNGERLEARKRSEGVRSVVGGSVAEPLRSDQIEHEDYYAPEVLAPLHVINVTVNQTTDSNEQLVQRDRKGLPLAVVPCGFSIDGDFHAFAPDANASSSIARIPTVGQWVGASGAAVGTGLGRTTTRGLSLLLGLANVRLGTWWRSCQWTAAEKTADRKERKWLGWSLEHVFATQYYLFCELTAQFHGMRRRWQYLSDGGHFDNTGIYELLRPEREVAFIVACDNGADVDGRFDDLANLVRLARIDFGLELTINQAICDEPYLGRIFGRPNDLVGHPASKRCAMLIDVFKTDRDTQERRLTGRIVVLKPRVISGTPLDVLQYAASHPTFPNESTAQQFFDEAQWESYRRLGVTIGRTVFGLKDNAASATTDALWRFLALDKLKPGAT